MITVSALIALDCFKIEYVPLIFVITVIQDLALIDLITKVAK